MIKTPRWLLAILLSFCTSSIFADPEECYSESEYPNLWRDSRYTAHSNGTVTDHVTKLMWAKCALGKNAPTCSGSNDNTYTWQEAIELASSSTLAGYTDWRLPNIKELSSLVSLNCFGPAINLNIFPMAGGYDFWSSSPLFPDDRFAWVISFSRGQDLYIERFKGNRVRFVRLGQ
jgi:hypothetical protein